MWQRAEAWALHFAVVYLAHSADSPTMGAIGRRILTALSDPFALRIRAVQQR